MQQVHLISIIFITAQSHLDHISISSLFYLITYLHRITAPSSPSKLHLIVIIYLSHLSFITYTSYLYHIEAPSLTSHLYHITAPSQLHVISIALNYVMSITSSYYVIAITSLYYLTGGLCRLYCAAV